MKVEDFYQFLVNITTLGNNVGTWLFTDLTIAGIGDLGKPIYWISGGTFLVAVGLWLKNKIVGDLG